MGPSEKRRLAESKVGAKLLVLYEAQKGVESCNRSIGLSTSVIEKCLESTAREIEVWEFIFELIIQNELSRLSNPKP